LTPGSIATSYEGGLRGEAWEVDVFRDGYCGKPGEEAKIILHRVLAPAHRDGDFQFKVEACIPKDDVDSTKVVVLREVERRIAQNDYQLGATYRI
jgi:hypothetical protein